jgi:hypothetical protein
MQTLNLLAADHTGIFKSSINKLRGYVGGPPYIKVSARVVYDRADLDVRVVGKKLANTSQTATHSYRARHEAGLRKIGPMRPYGDC